jgi:hypothetical protein
MKIAAQKMIEENDNHINCVVEIALTGQYFIALHFSMK